MVEDIVIYSVASLEIFPNILIEYYEKLATDFALKTRFKPSIGVLGPIVRQL